MMASSKTKSDLYLASCLCDGLEDLNEVKTLFSINKANPNVIQLYGITPLHLIVGNSSESFADEVTKIFIQHGVLLSNGGDLLSVDDDSKTPFDYAFEGSYRAISLLNEHYPYNEISIQNLSNDSKANDADDNDDEEDNDDVDNDIQDNPVEYKLGKILINKGDFVAEYVPSEIDTSINKINNTTLITNDVDNSFIKNSSLSNSQELNYHNNDDNFDESHSSIYHSLATINWDDKNTSLDNKNIIEKISNDNFNENYLNKLDALIVSKSPNFNIININKNQNLKNYISSVNSAMIKSNKYNISLSKMSMSKKDCQLNRLICSETSFYSIDKEYEYIDPVKNVAFIERRLLVLSPGRRLTEHGEVLGPRTNTTYHVYLKRRHILERKRDQNYEQCQKLKTVSKVEIKISLSPSSSELLTTDWLTNYKFYQDLEDTALREYQNIDDRSSKSHK
ncbi:hypothetical protein HCN44_004764 [Aphidius gifuensis]|uniref:Uncharacterized protein n=1 Tax=Aphidius gifuensis TaxID=684658 RepID=A0A835CNA9_APHGI|nr:hypothetical protein HCN44_004764 [Aphidius gifuensis]